MIGDMKHIQSIGLIACAAFFVSCESTQTAGQGNQERKHLAGCRKIWKFFLNDMKREIADADLSQRGAAYRTMILISKNFFLD
jgi:hypothetical protein